MTSPIEVFLDAAEKLHAAHTATIEAQKACEAVAKVMITPRPDAQEIWPYFERMALVFANSRVNIEAAASFEPPEKNPPPLAPELKACLDKMGEVSNAFYRGAIRSENHAFIEFTGLINEYIKICSAAARRGQDFRESSTHTGQRMEIASFQLDYIREKLECIYGIDVLAVNPDDYKQK